MNDDPLPQLAIALLALAFSTWSASVWTALASLTRGRLRRLDTNRHLAERADSWLNHRETYRLVIRVFTLTGITVGVIAATHAIALHPIAVGAGWLMLYLAASEAAGAFGRRFPWKLLALSVPFVKLAGAILLPIIVPVRACASAGTGDGEGDDELSSTADEIVSLVEQDAQQENNGSANLEDNERRMILGVMDLDETYVKEIMTPRVDIRAISADASVKDLKAAIVESGHSRIPVYAESVDDIIGIVYSRDLHDEVRTARVRDVRPLMHHPVFVPETKAVSELLEELKQQKVHMAVVIDEYGGTAGLVTIEDILEEIVGEIRDEYDHDEEDLLCEVDENGIATVDARIPIDQINQLLSLEISVEEDFDTIGGYVASELGRIPKTAEEFAFGDLKCTILAADQRKISRIQLHRAVADA